MYTGGKLSRKISATAFTIEKMVCTIFMFVEVLLLFLIFDKKETSIHQLNIDAKDEDRGRHKMFSKEQVLGEQAK